VAAFAERFGIHEWDWPRLSQQGFLTYKAHIDRGGDHG
jgi:hypothetical protein